MGWGVGAFVIEGDQAFQLKATTVHPLYVSLGSRLYAHYVEISSITGGSPLNVLATGPTRSATNI